VNPHALKSGDVCTPSLSVGSGQGLSNERVLLVHRDDKGQSSGVIADDEDRPSSEVLARNDPVKVDQWSLRLHRLPKPDILGMVRILAPVAVVEKSVLAEGIIVGAFLPGVGRCCRDCEGQLLDGGRFEDALRADKRHPDSLESKTALKNRARKYFTVPKNLALEKIERRHPDPVVTVHR
jgi:hypothetical protein